MNLSSRSFRDGAAIPPEHAFAKPDPTAHVALSGNRNPELSWSDVPQAARSLAIICVDPDAPTVPDNVNQEGQVVPADLPRADFFHWVIVDIPPGCSGVAAGECSDGVTPHGKQNPSNPVGAPQARQGVSDYTGWFAGDPEMSGTYLGYDGPAPPWNDQRVHRYHFTLYALDLERCPVEGEFTAADVKKAIDGHVLAEATITGTYTLNPELAQTS
jgi:Raf kinase inhibitor-like YbhB/YbcL family protein